MTENGLTEGFEKLIVKLQKINKYWVYGHNMPKSQTQKIHDIGATIKEKNLISKCEDQHFAKQLLMKNNVPEEYYK